MSAGRVIGGILALVAGVLLLIGALWAIPEYHIEFTNPVVISNLAIACVMIVGGILGLVKLKTVGGIVALIAGIISIMGGLLIQFTSFYYLLPLSLFYYIIPIDIFYFFAIEAIIAIVGGIILLVSKEK
jgi:hypothetical protein